MSRLMTKPTKWHVRPAKTLISLGIRPVWSESLLSAWRNHVSIATHWAHSGDSDQTGRTPRLIWGLVERTCHFVGFIKVWLISILLAWNLRTYVHPKKTTVATQVTLATAFTVLYEGTSSVETEPPDGTLSIGYQCVVLLDLEFQCISSVYRGRSDWRWLTDTGFKVAARPRHKGATQVRQLGTFENTLKQHGNLVELTGWQGF